jgi:alpha-glucosidase
VVDEHDDRVAIGEVVLFDEAAIARYYGDGDELHLSFNFRFLWAEPTAGSLRQRITTTLGHLLPVGAWPTWVLSNHDVPRHRGRHGGDETLARMMAVLLLTLPGTPFLYQGECLGLVDAEVPPERTVDPGGRDGCRAPMPWTAEPNHGWPTEPWLPFAPEVEARNVASMRQDPSSMLHLYRSLLDLRRSEPQLQTGSFAWLDDQPTDDDVLAYRRGDDWTVVLTLGDAPFELEHAVRVGACTDLGLVGAVISSVPPRTAIVGRRS